MKRLLPLLLALVLTACSPSSPADIMQPSTSQEYIASHEADTPSTQPATSAPTDAPTEAPTEPPPPPYVTVQMAGDIVFHPTITKSGLIGEDKYDFVPYFKYIQPYIDADYSIINLEMPIDVYGGNKKLSGYPMFNGAHEVLPALKDTGFDFLLTANNHAFDQYEAGLITSRRNILEAGFAMTGTYESQEQHDTPVVVDVGGIKLGIIAYSDSDNGMGNLVDQSFRAYAMKTFISWRRDDLPRMIEDIQKCREAGAEIVLFSLHWGAEYVDEPTENQKYIAHELAKNGADIIMGNHAHCVQPIEWVDSTRGGNSLIVYSLGNFMVDQIALDPPIPKTSYSMVVNFAMSRREDGSAYILDPSYTPTFLCRYTESTSPSGRYYMLLPSGDYAGADTRPDIFKSDTDWANCKSAYQHVTGIVGDVIPVRTIK
ncbi:MAG: CapA family protein [Eubacteriales bacterium]